MWVVWLVGGMVVAGVVGVVIGVVVAAALDAWEAKRKGMRR